MKIASLLLTVLLVLTACTTPPAEPTATTEPATPPSATTTPENPPATAPESNGADELAGTQWVLESFGPADTATPVVGETPITIEFDNDGQMGGNAGCNSYGGPYQVQENVLALGEVVSTLMACVDSAQMEQEVHYLSALQTVGEFQVEGDRLTISYDGGQGVLNYARASDRPATPESPATATPAPEAAIPNQPAGTAQDFIWNCFSCGGVQVWSFENGQASRVDVPVEMEYFFGYAPATGQILYSSPLPLLGGGPSQITVHDLWTFDVASGKAEPIFNAQNIVEAEWGPDGEHFAYVQATDSTYELRWHGLDGEDKLLASDVAFTFSVSPQGDKVAFTRESNYGLPGQPGLYVVDVTTGEEQLVADADRAGAGSIDDKPVWSPSGQSVLLPTYGTTGGPGLVRAAADGSHSVALGFDPSLAGEEWYQVEPFAPFWVSDTQLIASAGVGPNAMMGGPTSLVIYQLNDALDTIIGGQIIGEGQLIGWDIPGSSVWVQSGADMQSVPLPSL